MNRKLKLWELDRVDEETFKSQEKFPIYIVLNDIRSLSNIGTFFRTGDAFNVEKIFLCGITAVPPHREINKTALGATDTVLWEHRTSIDELVTELKSQGIRVAVSNKQNKPPRSKKSRIFQKTLRLGFRKRSQWRGPISDRCI